MISYILRDDARHYSEAGRLNRGQSDVFFGVIYFPSIE